MTRQEESFEEEEPRIGLRAVSERVFPGSWEGNTTSGAFAKSESLQDAVDDRAAEAPSATVTDEVEKIAAVRELIDGVGSDRETIAKEALVGDAAIIDTDYDYGDILSSEDPREPLSKLLGRFQQLQLENERLRGEKSQLYQDFIAVNDLVRLLQEENRSLNEQLQAPRRDAQGEGLSDEPTINLKGTIITMMGVLKHEGTQLHERLSKCQADLLVCSEQIQIAKGQLNDVLLETMPWGLDSGKRAMLIEMAHLVPDGDCSSLLPLAELITGNDCLTESNLKTLKEKVNQLEEAHKDADRFNTQRESLALQSEWVEEAVEIFKKLRTELDDAAN